MEIHNIPASERWSKIFADEDNNRELLATPGQTPAQRVIHTSDAFFRGFLMLWIAFGAAASFYSLFWAQGALYASLIGLVSGLASQLSLQMGRTELARWLFVLPLAMTTALAPWWVNGIRTPVLANMPMVLVLAGWMLGRRAMWYLAIAFFVSLTSMWWAELHGL